MIKVPEREVTENINDLNTEELRGIQIKLQWAIRLRRIQMKQLIMQSVVVEQMKPLTRLLEVPISTTLKKTCSAITQFAFILGSGNYNPRNICLFPKCFHIYIPQYLSKELILAFFNYNKKIWKQSAHLSPIQRKSKVQYSRWNFTSNSENQGAATQSSCG